MPDASADKASRTGRPLLWAAGLVLSVLVAAIVFVALPDREVVTPGDPGGRRTPATLSRPASASALLDELESALTEGSRRDVVALAAPGEPTARRQAAYLFDNVQELDLDELSFRFVDESGSVSRQERRTLGPDAWVGDVVVSWQVAGFDRGVNSTEVAFTFVDSEDGATFGSAGGDYGNPAPLWLLEDLAVRQSTRALVAATRPADARRYLRLADEAVRDVRAVLPRWRGRLVVEVPGSRDQLDRILDAEPGTYDAIAAVTATVDGSADASSPVHILVNRDVFANLGPDGSQIVMSHEATHVAVDATASTMPLWLLEGFADYVALARSDLPVSVTASQILRQVRRDGPPRTLPTEDEFDPTNKLLGTSYEAAWLACRLLAEEYGEGRLVAFYQRVDDGASLEEAFAELGTTEAAFTRQWRAYLRELAA